MAARNCGTLHLQRVCSVINAGQEGAEETRPKASLGTLSDSAAVRGRFYSNIKVSNGNIKVSR